MLKPRKPLDSAETARLVKIMGMTTSVHDGEKLNALAKAQELLTEHGLAWGDVIPLPGTQTHSEQARQTQQTKPPPGPKPKPQPKPEPAWQDQTWCGGGHDGGVQWWRFHWREYLHWCRAAMGHGVMTDWEEDFVESLMRWDGTPTDKQLLRYAQLIHRLEDIIARKATA